MANESVFRNGIVIKNGAQNGYILMSDTNGLASWTSSSVITANSATGSGSVNYVPRWLSSTNLSSTSSIYDSGTAVSIGWVSSGATLDVKAQGNGLLDIPFRVRNSADSADIFQVLGNANLVMPQASKLFVFGEGQGQVSTSEVSGRASLQFFNIQTCYLSTVLQCETNSLNRVKQLSIGGAYDDVEASLLMHNIGSTPSVAADTFKLWSTDITAGNAAPHFRTENGSIIRLYNYGTVSTVQGIADALTGMGILGTSSVDVLSGSGTAGYLPKFTGTYSIGNSGFADDGSIGGYISGGLTLSVAFTSTQALFRDGSITSPAISFQNDTDTGFYRNVNNQITVMSGGNTSSIFTDKGINLDSEITNNTVYGIATASNDSDAVRYSQLLLTESYLAKSGYVEGASFSGSPLIYTVSFATQFPDDNTYSISIIGEDSRAWSVSNVTKTQFTIESNSSTSLTGRVRWMAQKYNNA